MAIEEMTHQQHNRRGFLKKMSLGVATITLAFTASRLSLPFSSGKKGPAAKVYGNSVFTPREDQTHKA